MKKFKQYLNKRVLTVSAIAKKHDVTEKYVEHQLERGIRIEHERFKKLTIARRVVMANLSKDIDYYRTLKKHAKI
jgi:hypothetical protein